MGEKNIEYIVDNCLCTGCGGCKYICPKKAINIIETISGYLQAKIDSEKCIHCGLCVDVCPQCNDPGFRSIDDYLFGDVINSYRGHAANENIRLQGQTGGVVTSLLCYLLDSKKIDSAIVNSFDSKISNTIVLNASTKEELIEAAGSYYVQSAVLEKFDPQKKTAIVVLGCQAQALNYLKKNGLETPEYIIGLICAGNYSRHYISAISKYSGIKKSKITNFRFRDKIPNGWPGKISIKYNEKHVIMDSKIRHKLKPIYESYNCLSCFDQMNIMSDIVVGDPWGIDGDNFDKKRGESVIIVRTQKGQALLEQAAKNGYIEIFPLEADKIFIGQTVETRHKEKLLAAKYWINKKHYIAPKVLENSFFNASKEKINKKFEIFARLEYTKMIKNIKNIEVLYIYRIIYYFINDFIHLAMIPFKMLKIIKRKYTKKRNMESWK